MICSPIVPDKRGMSSKTAEKHCKTAGPKRSGSAIKLFYAFVRCFLAAAVVVAAAATAAVVADSVAAAAAAEQEDQDDDPPAVTQPVVVATHIRYLPTDICAAVRRADSSYSVGAIW